MGLRDELEERFAVAARGSGPQRKPHGWPALRLPPALRESLVAAAQLMGGRCPPRLADYYVEAMPRALLEQLDRSDSAVALLWRPIDRARSPRLQAALGGVFAALERAGLPAFELLQARTPDELVAARPSVAELYAPTLFASGLPMVGAYPAERRLLQAELAAGADPDALIDLRLSGNLVHELCHGPAREIEAPLPTWMVLEAAALTLGAEAFARHLFPDEPGEAVPGASLFVLLGQGLARLFGRRALYSLLVAPRPLALALAPAAALLEVAGWQQWLSCPEPPFARDALAAFEWVKLAAICASADLPAPLARAAALPPLEAARSAPPLLALAAQTPWEATAWWQGPPLAEDDELARTAVAALFAKNVLAQTFQTHPAEVPGGRIELDVAGSRLQARPRGGAAFAEPARWIFPPPLSRLLRQRGASRVVITGARRSARHDIGAALLELAHGGGPLPSEVEVRWTSSS